MESDVVLKISSSKDKNYVKRVAAAIGWQLRENGHCLVRAVKIDAINTAVKAVAITNDRVSKAGVTLGSDLFFYQITDSPNKATAISFNIQEVDPKKIDNITEFRVSGNNNITDDEINKLSAAISSLLRDKNSIKLRCIGPYSIYRAIYSITIARGLLYANGLETVAVPKWNIIPPKNSKDKPISLIEIELWTKSIL